ncbi:MAG: hypothetical protein JXL84_08415, partial [Deltaproteobacteria bacterium]|nr:hypothetical protein [Deltaproteobacteria bacterium]
MDSFSFEFKLADVDLDLLSKDAGMLKSDEAALMSALEEHLKELFGRLPGEAQIIPHDESISVMWAPAPSQDMGSVMDLAVGLIYRRAFAQAEPLLRSLLLRYPDDR